jgi:two-component sensor histidine kinase
MGEHLDFNIKNDQRGLLAARRAVQTVLSETSPSVSSSAVLLMSELVTNALMHGDPPVSASIDRRLTDVRISVSDAGRDSPFVRPRPDETGGYGLRIVDSLCERWGCDFSKSGKTVWCEVALPFAEL